MTRLLTSALPLALLCHSAYAGIYKKVPKLTEFFKAKRVARTFVPFDSASDRTFVFNEARAEPASRFNFTARYSP